LEARRVIEVVLESADGRVPVIAGVGSHVEDAPDLARFAAREGASAVLLSTPARMQSTDASSYLISLATELDVRVFVQEAPTYLGNSLGPDGLYRVLSECENVRDVKVEGGATSLAELSAYVGETAAFWGGDGGLHSLDCLRAGAVGFMPGVEVVDRLVRCYLAETRADRDIADQHLMSVLPLLVFEMQSLATYLASAKFVLTHRSLLRHDASRVEGATLSASLKEILLRHIHRSGLDPL
jgi:dihydrodipicolinate synthase/N-acetylneuraminate lyase